MKASGVEVSEELYGEFQTELRRIADWWQKRAVDRRFGGFCGQIDAYGVPVPEADKGVILNTRILWFYSEVCLFFGNDKYRDLADRAYRYLMEHFDDPLHGGVVWEVDYKGGLIDSRKQTYAQAFAVYALCAYYKLTRDETVIEKASGYFHLMEEHCHDVHQGGYLEAFTGSWGGIEDMRLSDKDANMPKTMNTHLHVLEAYTALHAVYPTVTTALALRRSIDYFEKHIINADNGHLRLFMEVDWSDRSTTFSYGHDIEGSWLLLEALQVLNDEYLLNRLRPLVLRMAQVCLEEGVGDCGQVLDEYCFLTGVKKPEGYWWVQAEALVGFLNAYRLSGNEMFYRAFVDVWCYIKQYHLDPVGGEWHWLAEDGCGSGGQRYKAGFWKAPYHNGRSMMEVCRLLDSLHKTAAPLKEPAGAPQSSANLVDELDARDEASG